MLSSAIGIKVRRDNNVSRRVCRFKASGLMDIIFDIRGKYRMKRHLLEINYDIVTVIFRILIPTWIPSSEFIDFIFISRVLRLEVKLVPAICCESWV